MRDWPVYGRNPANGKSGKEKQQFSPPKKFYLAEHLYEKGSAQQLYVRVIALGNGQWLSLLKLCRLPLLCTRVINILRSLLFYWLIVVWFLWLILILIIWENSY